MTAANILESALDHMQDRAATYDKPDGERSMGATVDAFKAVTGVLMTEEQGWLFMALLKAVRSQQGAYRADSYEDGAAYFALAGESAGKERAAVDKMAADFGCKNMTVDLNAAFKPIHPASFAVDPADVEIYLQSWRDSDAAYSKSEMASAISAELAEPAAAIDDESPRADAIGQNGNTGEHYDDPWADAPEWAKYKAQDANGSWYWFSDEPDMESRQWYSGKMLERYIVSEPNPNWRTTLISR